MIEEEFVKVLVFIAGGVAGFLLLALPGRPQLDAEVPMRVPSIVVANSFPLVAALAAIVLPVA